MVSNNQLDKSLLSINQAVASVYLGAVYSSHLPRPEVLHEAKKDLGSLLTNVQYRSSSSVKRVEQYGLILDTLLDIPDSDVLREKDFVVKLHSFALRYSYFFEEIIKGDMGHIIQEKYKLIEEKSKLKDEAEFGEADDATESKRKLIKIGELFIELLGITDK